MSISVLGVGVVVLVVLAVAGVVIFLFGRRGGGE